MTRCYDEYMLCYYLKCVYNPCYSRYGLTYIHLWYLYRSLVFIPLFGIYTTVPLLHKIKCHICPSHCSFYGIADFGKAWRQKKVVARIHEWALSTPELPAVKKFRRDD
jgi:hypothetical protein